MSGILVQSPDADGLKYFSLQFINNNNLGK